MADVEVTVGFNRGDAAQGIAAIVSSFNNLKSSATGVRQPVDAVGQSMALLTARFGSFNNALSVARQGVAALGAGFATWKTGQLINEATQLAARFQTLGVVLGALGKNIGQTQNQMVAFARGVQAAGITMQESRQVIANLVQSNIDLSKATNLARVAQDAAVIGQINSSEALSRMVYGIKTAQVEVLRTIGINVNFETSYMKLATQLNKNVNALTQTEKAQARVNAVLTEGKRIAGTYEAALGTAGKQISSMERYATDLQTNLGRAFLPAFTKGIFGLSEALKSANKWLEDNVETLESFGYTLTAILSQVGTLAAFITGTLIAKALVPLGRTLMDFFAFARAGMAAYYTQTMLMSKATMIWSAAAGGLVPVLLGAAAALGAYVYQQHQARDAAIERGKQLIAEKNSVDALTKATGALTEEQMKQIRVEEESKLREAKQKARDAAGDVSGGFFTSSAAQMLSYTRPGARGPYNYTEQDKVFRDLENRWNKMMRNIKNNEWEAAAAASDSLQKAVVDAQSNASKWTEDGVKSLDDFAGALATVDEGLDTVTAQEERTKRMFDGVGKAAVNTAEAVRDLGAAFGDLVKDANLSLGPGGLETLASQKLAANLAIIQQMKEAPGTLAGYASLAQRRPLSQAEQNARDELTVLLAQYGSDPKKLQELEGILREQNRSPVDKAALAAASAQAVVGLNPRDAKMRSARLAAENEAATLPEKDRPEFIAYKMAEAEAELQNELAKSARSMSMSTQAAVALSNAYSGGRAAVFEQTVANRALQESEQSGIGVAQAAFNIRTQMIAEERASVADRLLSAEEELSASQKMSEAWESGAAAASKQEIANRALSEVRKLYAMDTVAAAEAEERLKNLMSESKSNAAYQAGLQQLDQMKQTVEAQERLAAASRDGVGAMAEATAENERATFAFKLLAEGLTETDERFIKLMDSFESYQGRTSAASVANDMNAKLLGLEKDAERAKMSLQLIGATNQEREYMLDLLDLELYKKEQIAKIEATINDPVLRQQALNDLKQRVAEMGGLTRTITEARIAEEEAAKARDLWLEPFKNAISGIQSSFTSMFESIYSGGVNSFKEFASSVKQIFVRLAAELTTLMVFRPMMQGMFGGTALGNSMGLAGAGNAVGGNNLVGGVGSMGNGQSGSGGLLSSLFGSNVNLSGGQWNTGYGTALFGSAGVGPRHVGATSGLFGSGGGGSFGSALNSPIGGGILSGLVAGGMEYASGGSAATSIGAGVGGMIGGIAGSYFGPVGTMIGSTVGSIAGKMIGGLFAKKPKWKKSKMQSGATLGFDQYGLLGVNDTYSITKRMDPNYKIGEELGNQASDAFNDFMGSIGAEFDPSLTGDVRYLYRIKKKGKKTKGERESWAAWFGGQHLGTTQNADELMPIFLSGALAVANEQGKLGGLSPSTGKIFQNVFNANGRQGITDEKQIQEMLDFGKFYDRVDKLRTPADAAADALKNLRHEMNNARASAEEYGLEVEKINDIYRQNFEEDISDQLMQIEDPIGYALKEFEKEAESRLAIAKELGANLVDVERLNAIQREQVVNDAMQNAMGNLRDFFDSLLLGDQSTLTPEQKYNQAAGRYNDVMASGSKEGFTDAAKNLLDAAQAMFASGQEYADIFSRILGDTRTLGNIKGFADGGVARGIAVVGENGTELVNLGSSSSVINGRIAADYVASLGGGGDTELAHINKAEQEVLIRMGGSGTINPLTGLREFKYGADTKEGGATGKGADGKGGTGGGKGGDKKDKNKPSTKDLAKAYGDMAKSMKEAGISGVGDSNGKAPGTGGGGGGKSNGTSLADAYSQMATSMKQAGLQGVGDNTPGTGNTGGTKNGPSDFNSMMSGLEDQAAIEAANQAAVNDQEAYKDYANEGFWDKVGAFFAGMLGFNEINPYDQTKNPVNPTAPNSPSVTGQANWGFDPVTGLASIAGFAAGIPGMGLIADQLSSLLGRPFEINMGPSVFGGFAPAGSSLGDAGGSGTNSGLDSIADRSLSTGAYNNGRDGGGNISSMLTSALDGSMAITKAITSSSDNNVAALASILEELQRSAYEARLAADRKRAAR